MRQKVAHVQVYKTVLISDVWIMLYITCSTSTNWTPGSVSVFSRSLNLSWTKRRQKRRTPISEVDSKNQYGANCNLLTLTFKTNFKSLRKSLQWSTNLTIRYTLILGRGDVWESNFFHIFTQAELLSFQS